DITPTPKKHIFDSLLLISKSSPQRKKYKAQRPKPIPPRSVMFGNLRFRNIEEIPPETEFNFEMQSAVTFSINNGDDNRKWRKEWCCQRGFVFGCVNYK
ncbi:hypothetical protein AVEN_176537-1, partial [Araneus ventricosus]